MATVSVGKLSVSSICVKNNIAGQVSNRRGGENGNPECQGTPQWLTGVPHRDDPNTLFISYTEDTKWGSKSSDGAVHAVKVQRNGGGFSPAADTRLTGFAKQGGMDLNGDSSVLGMLCGKSVPEYHTPIDGECPYSTEYKACWDYNGYGALPMVLAVCEIDTATMAERESSRWQVNKQYSDKDGWVSGMYTVSASKGISGEGSLTYNVKHKTWSAWYHAKATNHIGSSYRTFIDEGDNVEPWVATDRSGCANSQFKGRCFVPPGLKRKTNPKSRRTDKLGVSWNACGGHEWAGTTTYNPNIGENALFCHAGKRGPNVFLAGFENQNEWNTNKKDLELSNGVKVKDSPKWGDGQDKGGVQGLSTMVGKLERENYPKGAWWEGGIRSCGKGFIVAAGGVRWRGEDTRKVPRWEAGKETQNKMKQMPDDKPIPIPDKDDLNFEINSENMWAYAINKGNGQGAEVKKYVEQLMKEDGVYAICQRIDESGLTIAKKIVSTPASMHNKDSGRYIQYRSVRIATLGSDPAEGQCDRFLMGWATEGEPGAPLKRYVVEIDGQCNRLTEPMEVGRYTTWPEGTASDWFTFQDGAVGWVNTWQRGQFEVECKDGRKVSARNGPNAQCTYGAKGCVGTPDKLEGSKCRNWGETKGYMTNEAFITTYRP